MWSLVSHVTAEETQRVWFWRLVVLHRPRCFLVFLKNMLSGFVKLSELQTLGVKKSLISGFWLHCSRILINRSFSIPLRDILLSIRSMKLYNRTLKPMFPTAWLVAT